MVGQRLAFLRHVGGGRGTFADKRLKRLRTSRQGSRIRRCPAQVAVLCEATAAAERLLQQSPVAGALGETGSEGRSSFEH